MKPMVIITLMVSVLIVGSDFFSRVLPNSNKSKQTVAKLNVENKIQFPQLSNRLKEQLNTAYNSYQQEPKILPENTAQLAGLSRAEQLAQHGDLTDLFTDNYRYRLLAIIEPQGEQQALYVPIAILKGDSVNNSSPKTVIKRVYHGSIFEGYQVKIKDTKSINLIRQKKTIALHMYKPKLPKK